MNETNYFVPKKCNNIQALSTKLESVSPEEFASHFFEMCEVVHKSADSDSGYYFFVFFEFLNLYSVDKVVSIFRIFFNLYKKNKDTGKIYLHFLVEFINILESQKRVEVLSGLFENKEDQECLAYLLKQGQPEWLYSFHGYVLYCGKNRDLVGDLMAFFTENDLLEKFQESCAESPTSEKRILYTPKNQFPQPKTMVGFPATDGYTPPANT